MSRERHKWSPFASILLVAAALAASGIRWYLQGSGNLYTALSKRFYVPDPDLGWRISTQHPIWLGLDACAVIVALGFVLVGLGFVVRRFERAQSRWTRGLRALSWLLASASLSIPAIAFASGPGPLHARDTLPPSAAVLLEEGIEGGLDAPEGDYVVVNHAGTSVTAHLSAGGEAFDARFAEVTGSWHGTPQDLARAMHGAIAVATSSIDTGVGERTKHARNGYLHADLFPQIGVTFDRLTAVRTSGDGQIAFRAPARVALMGRTHAVDIAGTVTELDPQALSRVGLTGHALLVQCDFSLAIRETALAPKANDLDGDRIPIHVSLLLRRMSD
jgi:polyisoprenoid-binding protein YceI